MRAIDRCGLYRFRPMTVQDLPMIKQWLTEPHVIEWWGDPAEQFTLVAGDLDEPAMRQFIVGYRDEDFGYIQTYDLRDWPQPALEGHPPGTLGIDQFIGKSDMIDRGHGSAFIRYFVDALLHDGVARVMTDPNIANRRAIKAYEKAGFQTQRAIETLDGPALLMLRDPMARDP